MYITLGVHGIKACASESIASLSGCKAMKPRVDHVKKLYQVSLSAGTGKSSWYAGMQVIQVFL